MDNAFYTEVINSSKTLTPRETLKVTDTRNAEKIDDLTRDAHFAFSPDYYVILNVHNEASKDKEYTQIIIITTDNRKLVTGSKSFIAEFTKIFEVMATETEPYEVEAYRVASKNYSGKDFLTCSLV